MKKRLIIFLVLLFMISGCTKDADGSKANNTQENSIDEIISQNNYIIVDVRTKEEYDSGHVIGAINIPYDTIDANTNLDKTKTILVYCKSGSRSAKAYQVLKSLKFDVYDLGAYDNIKLDKK